ncbi:MAG TPA: NAD(P)/FAD-dependent oxidoreductase [Nocardioidaceae bacterium]|nr:NAD(P)/FAD-dependent oxidoreductase [Nocardioidaceae bacterium]
MVSTSSTYGVGSTDVDVLIVGAGPVGLYGAYYAGVRGLSVGVVDSLSQVGGQVSAMYPEKQIYDVGGFPTVLGRDLVAALFEQAASAHPTYLLDQEAQTLDIRDDGRMRVVTSTGNVVDCGAVVVTGGIGTFSPRQLPAGEDFLGRGLEYFVTDVEGYAGRDVLVVGGGDSAFDWCLMLEPLASSVTLVHRRERFRAQPGTVEKVRETGVRIVVNAEVAALNGDGTVAGATIAVRGEPAPLELACQRVVAALGFKASLGPMREWGVQMHDNRHLVVDSAMRTNLPGVFGAGDVVEYDGKVRLIATGFGEVATAVNNAAVHIDPDAHLFPGHTSEMPAPESQPV